MSIPDIEASVLSAKHFFGLRFSFLGDGSMSRKAAFLHGFTDVEVLEARLISSPCSFLDHWHSTPD